MTYQPSAIAARVTDAHKRAVWDALAPPARLMLDEIARLTGVPGSIVCEIWAQGRAAEKLRYVDDGCGCRGIERGKPEGPFE